MKKIVNLLLFFFTLIILGKSDDEDIIDITKINVFPQDYKTKLRAGYLSVTPYTQSFYYILCQSENNPKTDPLILWLNGGPGCSSLTGFFTQNGPFMFKEEDASQMYLNPYRWNKKASVLYLQSPGLVGFSKASKQYAAQNDSSVARDNLIALIQFFTRYSQYKGSDFYIAGESYAGIYIPQLARQILDYNEQMQEIHFNLMGILIGNACTMKEECTTSTYYSRFTTEYFYTRGFIQQTQYNDYRSKCLANDDSQSTSSCIAVQKSIYNNFINSGANIYNIYAKCYTPVYPPRSTEIESVYEKRLQKYHQTEQGLKHPLRCTDSIGPLTVLNRNQFRAEFKVDEKNDTLFWTPCSDTLKYTMEKDASYGLLADLAKSGLRIFYYSGDLDAIVPITGTIYWFDLFRKQFGQAVKKSWRPWITPQKIFPNNQNTSGMVWQLDTMTFATVRGAGHMVPSDKPAQAQQILNVFLDPQRGWKYPDYYMQSKLE